MNGPSVKNWNIPLLAGAIAITVILAASWFVPGPWRDMWDSVDQFVFFTLNGMVASHEAMAIFWALANNRSFDLLPALLFAVLFWRHMVHGGPAHQIVERSISCLLMAAYVLLVTHVLEGLVFDLRRASPSLILEPAHRLKELVPWLPTKDSSAHSFPGDHGTVSIIFSLCLVWCYGPRAIKWGPGLVALACLPRLVGGAQWFTDIAVGSMVLALPTTALVFTTPLHAVLVRSGASALRRGWPGLDELAGRVVSPATPALIGKGMCMGTADIIPGVSGGTMAYILGIYNELLEALTTFNSGWFRHVLRMEFKQALSAIPFLFLLPLGFGIALAVFVFTRMIPLPHFVQHYPEPVFSLFFGLVGGSIVLLLRQHARPCVSHAAVVAAGMALGLILVSLVPANTPDTSWFIALCGMLAISAMLLPGISGSFILLILGKYALILGAVGTLDFGVLLPFALGCVVGLLLFAHSLRWLMHRFQLTMNLLIIGLLMGSMKAVWPFQARVYVDFSGKEKLVSSTPFWPAMESWAGLVGVMLLLGLGLIYLVDRLGRNRTEQSRL